MLLLQLACTLTMTGIIWFVQVVHYPLFARVGQPGFAAYEAEHATRTGWVVGPLMCLELGAAFLFLLPRFRPMSVPATQAAIGALLVTIIWLSTALIQVPLHSRLGAGFDAAVIAKLVATNWIRTIAWTLRAALVLFWTSRIGEAR
jgi:hypothetical protein